MLIFSIFFLLGFIIYGLLFNSNLFKLFLLLELYFIVIAYLTIVCSVYLINIYLYGFVLINLTIGAIELICSLLILIKINKY